MLDESVPHGLHNYNPPSGSTSSDAAIDTLVSHVEQITSPLSQVILARMGGAVARVENDATVEPPPRDQAHLRPRQRLPTRPR